MKEKNPPYEKPILEPLLISGEGQSPACIDGSSVDGNCSPQGVFASTGCSTGTSPGSG